MACMWGCTQIYWSLCVIGSSYLAELLNHGTITAETLWFCVFFYKWYCTKLCSLWFLAGPLKSKLQLLPSGNFRNNFPSMFLLLNNFSFILWGSLDLLSHHKYSYSSSSFATVLKTRFSQCSFVWPGDKV